jgi:hypothetical protein
MAEDCCCSRETRRSCGRRTQPYTRYRRRDLRLDLSPKPGKVGFDFYENVAD